MTTYSSLITLKNKRIPIIIDHAENKFHLCLGVTQMTFDLKELVYKLGFPYLILEPDSGFKRYFSTEEKAKLRPIAETLAMLDGNAFFTNKLHNGSEWYEQYLPEAHALYEANGGDDGWAGKSSIGVNK